GWYPESRFMTASDFLRYPWIVELRLRPYFVLGWIGFGIVMIVARPVVESRVYRFLCLTALAATSWYFLMYQHVTLHVGSGSYAWFGALLIFSVVGVRSVDLLRSPGSRRGQRRAAWAIALALGGLAVFGLA